MSAIWRDRDSPLGFAVPSLEGVVMSVIKVCPCLDRHAGGLPVGGQGEGVQVGLAIVQKSAYNLKISILL